MATVFAPRKSGGAVLSHALYVVIGCCAVKHVAKEPLDVSSCGRSIRAHPLCPVRPKRTAAAAHLAWALAELREQHLVRERPRDGAQGVRRRNHSLRPGEQLRTSGRL